MKGYPTQEEMDAFIDAGSVDSTAIAYAAASKYQKDRKYPTWQEQFDMQYWDLVNGTTTWEDAIAKVKSDNPKPE